MAPKTITKEHREAITAGRAQNAAVALYLELLATPRRRGRRVDLAAREAEHADVVARLDADDVPMLDRLHLVQRRLDLEALLAEGDGAADEAALEEAQAGFVEHAAAYSERRGITYAAWREAGVPAAVLRAAGIGR